MEVFRVRFALRGRGPLALAGFTGEIALALALRWIEAVDGRLARELHDSKRPKPLAVSPIYLGGRPVWLGGAVAEPGREVYFYAGCGGVVCKALIDGAVREAGASLGGAQTELVTVETTQVDFSGEPPPRFQIDFITPTRFARRPLLRRRRAQFDFCPTPINIAKSAYIHWSAALGSPGFDLAKILRWAYTYVYMADMYGRVAATQIHGKPQLGFVGRAKYEIRSKAERRRQFWALVKYAEVFNVGAGRGMGLGHIRVTPGDAKEKAGGERRK